MHRPEVVTLGDGLLGFAGGVQCLLTADGEVGLNLKFNASMRSRYDSVTSTGETSLRRINSESSVVDRKGMSIFSTVTLHPMIFVGTWHDPAIGATGRVYTGPVG